MKFLSKKTITLFSILALMLTLVVGNVQLTAADDADEDAQEVTESGEVVEASDPAEVTESDGAIETGILDEENEAGEVSEPEEPEQNFSAEPKNDQEVVESYLKEHQNDPDFAKKEEYINALSDPRLVANLLWLAGELDEYIEEGAEAEGKFVDLYYADRCDQISIASEFFVSNDTLWHKASWRAKRLVTEAQVEY